MGKLASCAVLLLASVQAACTAGTPVRPDGYVHSLEPIQPDCDTSIGYLDLVGSFSNRTGGAVDFHLDDFEGPPLDPSYMAYRVWAGAPGGRLELVHNSGHDSIWDRTVRIPSGGPALLHIPIFGLRPADYYRYFRVEYRDARNRSYWTPEFTLCAVAPVNCRCPAPAAPAVGANLARPACPLASAARAVPDPGEISLLCR